MEPRVSVICLCFNHAQFVCESLDSVIHQTYPQVELIVVDDASSDNSVAVIREWLLHHEGVEFLAINENVGNCQAFNMGLRRATGKYIIDLSGDDRLTPSRIERGVAIMEMHPEVGVQFSDAELIDEAGKHLGFHSDRFPHTTIPQGEVFREVLSRYFINSPTMMIRKSLFDELEGYDESLAYEDFDFWVRSSQRTHYAYLPEPLVQRRMVTSSMGKRQYAPNSAQQWSTLKVCRKALALCRDREDRMALRRRTGFEFRQALRTGNLSLAWQYVGLWREIR